jgi:putative transposase
MPEHVHLLISEGPKCTPSLVMKVLKQRVSRDSRKQKRRVPAGQMDLAFKEGDARLPRFWQPRFYDFNVYSAKKVREKLEYMHANPVKRGLVGNPGERVWSSFSSYENGAGGLVPIDFAD